MIIQWVVFVPGVLLLLLPANLLLSSLVQLRTFDSFQNLDSSVRHRPWWWVPALWLDPLRAFGGTWLVKASLSLASPYWDLVPKPDYALIASVLLLGLVAQLYTRREPGVLLAPIGYVIGVMAALMPWPVTVVGSIAGVTGMFAFRHFQTFFVGGGVAVAFLGFVLGADIIWLAPTIALFVVPIVACLMTGRTLELPTRDATGKAKGL